MTRFKEWLYYELGYLDLGDVVLGIMALSISFTIVAIGIYILRNSCV